MKAYLRKDSRTSLKICRTKPIFDYYIIYHSQVCDFRGYPDEIYDEELIKALTAIFKSSDPALRDGFEIRVSGRYDTFLDKFRIFATVLVDYDFWNVLTNFITAPKISIAGSYCGYGVYMHFQLLDSDDDVSTEPETESLPFHVSEFPLKNGQSSHELQGLLPLQKMLRTSKELAKFHLTYSITLEWKDFSLNPQSLKPSVLEKIRSEMLLVDCTVVASNKEEFECHRNILAAHSDVLHVKLTNDLKESQTSRIEMNDLSPDGVRCLLAYMYGREPQLVPTESITIELLKTGHKYNIANLKQQMLKLLCTKPPHWFSTDGVLELYFFIVNIEEYQVLCEKLLHLLKMEPISRIQNAALYQEMLKRYPKEASELALKFMENDDR
ncbi:unnamed protein product [Orchesella dallaii]|uniref:BTB domain-containing protein n=1 Tax=Orchesella dallaii TaxID=48710 RepID=A0ABP1RTZ1_9HEXA